MKIILSVLCLLVVVGVASCARCSPPCGVGDRCCGNSTAPGKCYDPSRYDCVDGILCGQGEGECAGECYDKTKYACTADGHLYQGNSRSSLFCSAFRLEPCGGNATRCCEEECYDPSAYVCLNEQLCPTGHSVCNYNQCYDTTTQECCNNKIFVKGSSVCSQPGATCCACSCDTLFETQSYTVANARECNNNTISAEFGPLVCPGQAGGCPHDTCQPSCPNNTSFIFNYCFSDETYGCSGHYLCDGGAFSCGVSSRGQCKVTVKDTSNGKTNPGPDSTDFEPVGANYQGEVCCWCASPSSGQAISEPVSSFSNCTVANLHNQLPVSDLECRVWSRYTDADKANRIACGLPE